MLANSFYKQLSIIFISLSLLYLLLSSTLPIFSSFQDLFWLSQIFFTGLCIGSFYGGKHFVQQSNKNVFFRFIMLLIFFRLVASAIIVISYFNIKQPQSKTFLVPFFIVYLVYTIFEVYFLAKIGREN